MCSAHTHSHRIAEYFNRCCSSCLLCTQFRMYWTLFIQRPCPLRMELITKCVIYPSNWSLVIDQYVYLISIELRSFRCWLSSCPVFFYCCCCSCSIHKTKRTYDIYTLYRMGASVMLFLFICYNFCLRWFAVLYVCVCVSWSAERHLIEKYKTNKCGKSIEAKSRRKEREEKQAENGMAINVLNRSKSMFSLAIIVCPRLMFIPYRIESNVVFCRLTESLFTHSTNVGEREFAHEWYVD